MLDELLTDRIVSTVSGSTPPGEYTAQVILLPGSVIDLRRHSGSAAPLWLTKPYFVICLLASVDDVGTPPLQSQACAVVRLLTGCTIEVSSRLLQPSVPS